MGGSESKDTDKNTQQDHSWLNSLELNVHKLKDFNQVEEIGGDKTFLALKNDICYIVLTLGLSLKLVENDFEVYSGALPEGIRYPSDAIYVPSIDSYLLATSKSIYIKDIDYNPPYTFMEVQCSMYRSGACFRYSKMHQRLITTKDFANIAVIDPKARTVEFELKMNPGNHIKDFRVFGERENRVAAVTGDGYVVVYSLDYSLQKGSILAKNRIKLRTEFSEWPTSVSVCNKNHYILVEIGQGNHPKLCLRMFIFRVDGDSLVNTASIDFTNQQEIGEMYALECFGCVGSHILWLGLPWKKNAAVELIDYDMEKGALSEAKSKSVVRHGELNPYRLIRFGDKFYYTGSRGGLMCLSVNI